MVVQVRARELHDSCHYDFLTRQGTHKMNDVAVVLGVSATDAAALENLMSLAASLGTVKSVVFNVGNNQPMAFADLTADMFENFWRTCTLAGFLTAKAALRNLAQAVAKDYGPTGVHVGHVVVDGVINGERVQKHFGDYLRGLGEDGSLEPDAIADAYWFIHTQPRNTWTFEVDVRPYKEHW
jgi:NAD(P)-dependent dehydrogenase (short-subunit alcohol dehydrogenase family)